MTTTKEGGTEKYRVLLVEDMENIAKLFSYNMEKAGFECKIARNGREGFELATKFQPDIIISDIMMPEVDGFEFRKMLLNDDALKIIPFIFLTSKGEEEDILEGYNLDIEDYLIKTSSAKVIIAKINAILKSQQRERKKVVAEVHKAADNLGARVVPEKAPELEGFTIKHWHVPFENVPGGDFIDYFKIDDDNLAVILGDVMGKKWGAWYFAVAYAGYVRSAIRFVLESSKQISPSEIVAKVNDSIYKDERLSQVFITLSLIIINKRGNLAKYSGAGDLPLVYKSSEIKSIQSDGLLLGFTDDAKYRDHIYKLQKGDELFLLTDGIIESRNLKGEQFELKRLLDVLKNSKEDEDSFEKIKKEFSSFTGSKYEDDISLITIKKL